MSRSQQNWPHHNAKRDFDRQGISMCGENPAMCAMDAAMSSKNAAVRAKNAAICAELLRIFMNFRDLF